MVGVTRRHSRLWCGSADMVYILVDGGYSAWMALGLCIWQESQSCIYRMFLARIVDSARVYWQLMSMRGIN
jgi:hypothetical protein